ncbi:Ig-like domain-containing domain [Peijinzhouia sedimentorum]
MKFNLPLLFFILLVSAGCANQTTPTGGPEDTKPPILLSSDPEDREVNFTGKTITLRFNEYIKEEKLKEQLIISPSIDNPYTTKINRQQFELEFENDLDSATTFTFNFRDGIQDITEDNPAEDLILTFSTGPFIDSLNIQGSAFNLLTGDIKNDWIAGLYLPSDTLSAYNSKPRYFAKTDSSGNFSLRNLTPGVYELYVWEDKNSNLQINSFDEIHGYYPEQLNIDQNMEGFTIPLVLNFSDSLQLVSARPIGQSFLIRMNKPFTGYSLKPTDSTINIYSIDQPEDYSIKVFNTFPELGADSIQVQFTTYDSLGLKINKELYIKFTESNAEKEALSYTMTPTLPAKVAKNDKFEISFTKPMMELNADSISTMIDSVFTYYQAEDILEFNEQGTKAQIKLNLDTLNEGEKLQLIIPEGSYVSVENDTLERILATYEIKTARDFGTIKGTISNTDGKDFWVQLLNSQNRVIQELKNTAQYAFNLVSPGDYKIRVLVDSNKDGVWSKGNGRILEAPEPAFLYKKANPEEGENPFIIALRANWEVTDINISIKD